MSKFIWALAALSFIACNGDTGPGPQGDDDDSSSPTESGMLRVTVLRLGEPVEVPLTVDCLLNNGRGGAITSGDEPLLVQAPSDCQVEVGDTNLTSQFGFPVWFDGDSYWGASIATVSTSVDSESVLSVDLFKMFEPGVYVCEHDEYLYDDSKPDFKGDFDGHEKADPQTITMDHDGKVNAEESSMGGMFLNEYMQSENDHLVLRECDAGFSVKESSIATTNFTYLFVIADFMVFDTHCDLR